MNTSDMEPIITKIKKCLALSRSDSPNESATALRQAQALMHKYGIDDIAMADAEIDVAEMEEKSVNSKRAAGWEARLIVLVANAFGCKPMLQTQARQARGRRSKAAFRFVGVKANALTASYTATVLLRQLRQSRRRHISALKVEARAEGWTPTSSEERSAGDAFCLGWLDQVGALVADFANPDALENAILRRQEEVTQGRKASMTRCRVGAYDQASIVAGGKEAKDVSLHRPVHSPKGTLALRHATS